MAQAMMGNFGGQPVLILPEGTLRSTGKDAQRQNITAAKAVADAVRTTLGPKGMDKMLVNSIGVIVITNDGVTILQEMDIEHPAAKMMVEVAKTQNEEVGDGTTTSFTIPHSLIAVPRRFSVLSGNAAAGDAEIRSVTPWSTNLTVAFKTAPANGTNNITLHWWAEC